MVMPEDIQVGGESRLSYIPARVEVNAKCEIVVTVNSGFSMFSRIKYFAKSDLKVMIWDGAVLRDAWHST
jgi:hypothetical protein